MNDTSWVSFLKNGMEFLPWLFVAAIAFVPLALAYFGKIFPTLRWLIIFAPIAILSVLAAANPRIAVLVIILDVMGVAILAADLLPLLRPCKLRVRRLMKRSASLAKPHEVNVEIDNDSDSQWKMDVRDDQPDGMTATPDSTRIVLPSKKRAQFQYSLFSNRRGAFELQKVYFRLHTWLGLWVRLVQRPVVDSLRVYPDMKQLSEYAVLAKTNRLSLIGVRKTRRIGQDNNFERLRDYADGDNYRHIDWRSTARRNRLTVKQYQADQSQRIHFMIDCGRMMTNEYEGLSLVDYAFNSMLMLSYVALHQRDSVGLTCFSDRVHDYVPSAASGRHMNRLLHATYDRFPSFVQSRFDLAFLHLSNHCRRRSMVVLITNVIDVLSANQITDYLSNLSGRHLPILVLLRDHRIFDYADYPDMDETVLYRSAAAAELLTWRNEVLQNIRQKGILVVDAFPEQLTAPLVNQYLEAKSRHLL
ncbi:MAG: DUF58 domain-containing protein [Planctomycetota bacterium]|nr:DUF58 domain-containing protein [Planctomycetota bacterium]